MKTETKRWFFYFIGMLGFTFIHPALPIAIWGTTMFLASFTEEKKP